jgi:hypothetical protein
MLALAVTLATAGGVLHAVTEPPPDPIHFGLYEWMATAPIVVAADVLADDGKFVVARTIAAVKGGKSAAGTFEVDAREANRDRDEGVKALDLVKGRAYLFLLRPSSRGKKEPHPVFALERGVQGARELPAEGSQATIDAAVRLGAIQERRSDELLWASLPEFLQDENPVLVDAALELYVKFRRESASLIPIVEPLMEHPRPDFRRRAALLLGRTIVRPGAGALPERSEIIGALIGRARRDDDASVRREATIALSALPDLGVEETLRTIAADDPDQDVRLEAEKSLYARRLTAPAQRAN